MRRARRFSTLAIAVAVLAGGTAGASECGEQIKLLDGAYHLALLGSDGGRTIPSPDQAASAGAGGTQASTAGLDTIPNTGGVANPRNTPVEPLTDAEREGVRAALLAAQRADAANDATTCAAKVAEARRIAHDGKAEPRAQ